MTVTQSLIDQLQNKYSAKRRSAALKLRKLGDPDAGPAILEALMKELKDKRTWETQYQMIMALGHSGYVGAIPFLEILAHEKFEATMVLVAIGDAWVRLSRTSDADATPLLRILGIENDELLHDGALRATAMLRMCFDEENTAAIIRKIEKGSESRKFWLVAACPGWSGSEVDRFINQCANSDREDIRSAAEDAKLKKYRKWRPL